MKIFIDADGTPVLKNVIHIAKKYEIDLIIVKNYAHSIENDYAQIISVDVERDSADLMILKMIGAKDLLVTQDYGLAALALSKKAYVINQDGLIFTDNNINQLLNQRHDYAQVRRSGKRHQNQGKRKKEANDNFQKKLETYLQLLLKTRL